MLKNGKLDKLDKKLLNLTQQGLPLTEFPFQLLGAKIGLTAEEVVERLKKMKENGYIRRIGGIFNSERLGFKTTLVAVQVPENDFYPLAKLVRAYPNVTHCYRRDDNFNLWFTLTVKSNWEKRVVIKAVEDAIPTARIYDLPKEKCFKLKVFFDLADTKND